MTNLVVFGTELEELDDEERDVLSRRPLGVQEQVVRDEKGRRRFHGAFTGGFSAGYFNTVGTKEGWQPKQFRSSRDERGERFEQRAEDFMDEEDMGEFGIASRRMRTALDDTHQRTTQKLAWERTDHSALDASLASRIESLVRPVRESMGVRLLKKMGWREGQGIGPKMSRRALEKHKLNELRARGRVGSFNEEAVREVEEMAPGFEFAPDDVLSHYLHSRDGVRGLGYEGLRTSDVLSERYGMQEASLKTKPKSKGIRGQAFGVGAFEDDDESIYTNYDLSQYDFAIGGNDAPSTSAAYSYDPTFVMAEKRQRARSFFEPPRLPHSFRPIHRPILLEISALPDVVKKFSERMNHVQRAKFLGEVDKDAVMELIRDEDRKRLAAIRMGSSNEPKKDYDDNIFEEEPMKQARFKQYVQYLKRGLSFPQPLEMTSLEWENELAEFQRILPSHLRSLLPEVKARQLPLANAELAIPIAQALKSKFTVASGRSDKRKRDER
uniref:G patch domain-containing protein 1 n=1 Tax=Ascaris suum TaxID=6253 RepID=F1KVZ8_ASCSU